MSIRIKYFFAILLVAATMACHAGAQNLSFYSGLSKTLYDGRYYPALFGENVAPTFPTFNVKMGWTDNSSSPYAFICKHPEVGIGFQFDGLADVTTVSGPGMGNIYSVYAYIDRPVITFSRFSFGYSGAFGLGFMFSKRFHPDTNPVNVVISSPVNAHISLGVQAKYDITPRYDAGIGFYFNHHSNGAVSFPNYGLNAFELALRLGMKPARSAEGQQPLEREDDGFKPHFQFEVQLSTGVISNEAYYERVLEEEGVWVNDLYFKYAFEASCLYRYCRTHATGLGFDLFVTPFCDKIAENDGRGNTYDPFSYGFSVLHAFNYYNFTTMVGVGRYIHHNDGLAPNKTFYQLVQVKYYFPKAADLYAGIILKAHKFKAAECIQFCIGKRF